MKPDSTKQREKCMKFDSMAEVLNPRCHINDTAQRKLDFWRRFRFVSYCSYVT